MKIVITGSLGHIGKPLTAQLLKEGHEVTVISSKTERKEGIERMGAKAAIGTMYDVDFLTAAFTGADAVYLMEAVSFEDFFNPDFDLIAAVQQIGENYKQAILKAAVPRVVHLSGMGAHMDKGNGMLVFHHNVEQLLKQLPEHVTVVTLRPFGFYYNLFEYIQIIKTKGVIVTNFNTPFQQPWTSTLDVAEAVAEELTSDFKGRKIRYVASDEKTSNEVAAILGEAIGKPDLQWVAIPDEQLLEGMIATGLNPKIAKGFVEMNAARQSGILFEDYYRNRPALGKVKMTDFAKDFAAVYHQ